MTERTNIWKRRAVLFGMLAAPLALAGCGRRSQPKPPEGSTYQREYPTRESLRLPPQEILRAPPQDEDDEAPPAPARPGLPAQRY